MDYNDWKHWLNGLCLVQIFSSKSGFAKVDITSAANWANIILSSICHCQLLLIFSLSCYTHDYDKLLFSSWAACYGIICQNISIFLLHLPQMLNIFKNGKSSRKAENLDKLFLCLTYKIEFQIAVNSKFCSVCKVW